MEYRINKRTEDKISVLGFGTSYIAEAEERDVVAVIQRAYEGGVNYYDLATAEAVGKCVYCNHCKPCPRGLDIGIINKYYDLARNGDSMAAEHYRNLEIKADACVQCGHCESRCPFHVKQENRMKEIATYFQ